MTVAQVFVRSAYNYDMLAASDESGLKCEDKSLAVQSAKEECDINAIVARFGLTGQLPDDVRAPVYGDFVGISSYHEAMNAVAEANEAFDALPWNIRARFHNDPAALIEFCSNGENRAEAEKLGLIFREKGPKADADGVVLPSEGSPDPAAA